MRVMQPSSIGKKYSIESFLLFCRNMTKLERELCLAISPIINDRAPEEWEAESKRALLAIIVYLRDNGYWQAADFLLSNSSL
jgi:hypothetical protein